MWRLTYNQEANSYALDSYPYNEDVLAAIESLALTENGIPASHCTKLEDEYFLWRVAHHIVVFQRIVHETELRILVIKPDH